MGGIVTHIGMSLLENAVLLYLDINILSTRGYGFKVVCLSKMFSLMFSSWNSPDFLHSILIWTFAAQNTHERSCSVMSISPLLCERVNDLCKLHDCLEYLKRIKCWCAHAGYMFQNLEHYEITVVQVWSWTSLGKFFRDKNGLKFSGCLYPVQEYGRNVWNYQKN